jgi:hypothetical protein
MAGRIPNKIKSLSLIRQLSKTVKHSKLMGIRSV